MVIYSQYDTYLNANNLFTYLDSHAKVEDDVDEGSMLIFNF